MAALLSALFPCFTETNPSATSRRSSNLACPHSSLGFSSLPSTFDAPAPTFTSTFCYAHRGLHVLASNPCPTSERSAPTRRKTRQQRFCQFHFPSHAQLSLYARMTVVSGALPPAERGQQRWHPLHVDSRSTPTLPLIHCGFTVNAPALVSKWRYRLSLQLLHVDGNLQLSLLQLLIHKLPRSATRDRHPSAARARSSSVSSQATTSLVFTWTATFSSTCSNFSSFNHVRSSLASSALVLPSQLCKCTSSFVDSLDQTCFTCQLRAATWRDRRQQRWHHLHACSTRTRREQQRMGDDRGQQGDKAEERDSLPSHASLCISSSLLHVNTSAHVQLEPMRLSALMAYWEDQLMQLYFNSKGAGPLMRIKKGKEACRRADRTKQKEKEQSSVFQNELTSRAPAEDAHVASNSSEVPSFGTDLRSAHAFSQIGANGVLKGEGAVV